jgi:hypothetical protein
VHECPGTSKRPQSIFSKQVTAHSPQIGFTVTSSPPECSALRVPGQTFRACSRCGVCLLARGTKQAQRRRLGAKLWRMCVEPYDLTIISFDDCLFQFSGGEREQGPRWQALGASRTQWRYRCPWSRFLGTRCSGLSTPSSETSQRQHSCECSLSITRACSERHAFSQLSHRPSTALHRLSTTVELLPGTM